LGTSGRMVTSRNCAARGAAVAGAVLLAVLVGCQSKKGTDQPSAHRPTASADGRLGVSQSIRGRIEDLGGTARLTTGPDGTEWEFLVPVS